MKSLKAIITTLIIGSSTIAVAQPVVRDHRDPLVLPVAAPTTVDYNNDHRRDADRALASPTARSACGFRMRPVDARLEPCRLSSFDRGAAFVSLDSRFGTRPPPRRAWTAT